jgi:NADPH:quinone reductase-like Zn-dependent oxidoreductase
MSGGGIVRAIVIQQYGGPEQLLMKELPDPQPSPGQVVVEVKAFGLNHAEIYFRKGEWGDVAKVSGIECVGVARSDATGRLREGQKVAALMGGMGRTFNGSYAELTRVPAENVVPLESKLSWAELAAIPESYATAWTCIHRNLALSTGHVLLVRGGTSALGQAAINIAAQAGAHVIATTRRADRVETLKSIGAKHVLLEAPKLSSVVRELFPRGIDSALELVGNSTLLDSFAMVRPDGRVCLAGFLGGGAPIEGFNPLMHMPSGVQFSFFASAFTFGSSDYPLEQIPFQTVVDRAAEGVYKAKPARIFGFEEIQEAHRLMESGNANGKIVVVIN